MSFDIEIKGLEELQRELKRMQEGLTVPTLNQWCKRIEHQARMNCPEEYKESISINAVHREPNIFDIELKAAKETLPHIRDAIQQNLSSMPITTRALFEVLLKDINHRMQENS